MTIFFLKKCIKYPLFFSCSSNNSVNNIGEKEIISTENREEETNLSNVLNESDKEKGYQISFKDIPTETIIVNSYEDNFVYHEEKYYPQNSNYGVFEEKENLNFETYYWDPAKRSNEKKYISCYIRNRKIEDLDKKKSYTLYEKNGKDIYPIKRISVDIGINLKKEIEETHHEIKKELEIYNKSCDRKFDDIFSIPYFKKNLKKIKEIKEINTDNFENKSKICPSIREALFKIFSQNKENESKIKKLLNQKNIENLINFVLENIELLIDKDSYKILNIKKKDIKNNIFDLLKREQEFYEKGLYPIYHSCNKPMALIREIISKITNILNFEKDNNRKYFIESEFDNIEEAPIIGKNQKDNDNLEFRKNVNSGTYTLFGNFESNNKSLNHESAMHYWLANNNVNGLNYAIFLREQLKKIGFTEKGIDEIVILYMKKLKEIYDTKNNNDNLGDIFQIFYSKEDMEKYSYLSIPYGRGKGTINSNDFIEILNKKEEENIKNPYTDEIITKFDGKSEIQSRFIVKNEQSLIYGSMNLSKEEETDLEEIILKSTKYILSSDLKNEKPKYNISKLTKYNYPENLLKKEFNKIEKYKSFDFIKNQDLEDLNNLFKNKNNKNWLKLKSSKEKIEELKNIFKDIPLIYFLNSINFQFEDDAFKTFSEVFQEKI